jgi:hypothetical protein
MGLPDGWVDVSLLASSVMITSCDNMEYWSNGILEYWSIGVME